MSSVHRHVVAIFLALGIVLSGVSPPSKFASNTVTAQVPFEIRAPWKNGECYVAGYPGSYYNQGYHTGRNRYAVDFNRRTCAGQGLEDRGEPVLSVANGTITVARWSSSYGWFVVVDHGNGYQSLYAHLNADPRVDPGIRENTYYPRGTTIGRIGSTPGQPYATGPHLHFALYSGRWDTGNTVRPTPISGQALNDDENGKILISNNEPPSPPSITYRAQWIDKNAHPVLRRGDCYGFFTRFRNVGTATWVRNIVRLGTDQPRDRIPSFIREDRCTYQSSGWLSGNRVALRESSVAPNGIGSFLFWYTVPSTMAWGVYPEYFRLVADGVTWMTEVDPWTFWNVNVIDCPSCQSRDHYHVWATGSGATNKAVFWAANSFVAKSPSIRRVTFNAAWSARAIVAIFNCPAMTWDSCLVAYQTVPVVQYGASAADWPTPVPVTVGRRYWVQIGATPQVPGNPLLAYFSATNSYRAADAPGQPAVDASCAVYHHISNATRTTDCGIDLNVRVESP